MSHSWSARAAATCLLFLVPGCGGETGADYGTVGGDPPGYVAPPNDESLPLVAHPEYANWSRFPVGIVVVRKKEVTNESGSVRVTTTQRLAEKTAEKVAVETQISIVRLDQPTKENPPLSVDFPATFPLPKGMKLEQFSLPSLKAKHVGEEVRSIGGQEYQTQLYTWDEVNEAGPMTVKLWRSDAIPGRMLRQEIQGRTQTSVEEVIEILSPEM